jgi:uncharacterized protein (TIGR02145 family)
VSDDAVWLSVNPASGSSNGTVTVTATTANTSTDPRYATVTVSGTGVGAKTVTVTQEGSAVTDIDGNVYATVQIGNQVWMAENLRVTHYRNGDSIPNTISISDWSGLTTGSYCEYNNNGDNVLTYGRLYNWHVVSNWRGIAPEGWHVPSLEEWRVLINQLGGESLAGTKMKEEGTLHWRDPNDGTNESKFLALPAGYRTDTGIYQGINEAADFWTITENINNVYFVYFIDLNFSNPEANANSFSKKYGFSIRCIKD